MTSPLFADEDYKNREGKSLAQGHTARNWRSHELFKPWSLILGRKIQHRPSVVAPRKLLIYPQERLSSKNLVCQQETFDIQLRNSHGKSR